MTYYEKSGVFTESYYNKAIFITWMIRIISYKCIFIIKHCRCLNKCDFMLLNINCLFIFVPYKCSFIQTVFHPPLHRQFNLVIVSLFCEIYKHYTIILVGGIVRLSMIGDTSPKKYISWKYGYSNKSLFLYKYMREAPLTPVSSACGNVVNSVSRKELSKDCGKLVSRKSFP